jgi:hypothetical protein
MHSFEVPRWIIRTAWTSVDLHLFRKRTNMREASVVGMSVRVRSMTRYSSLDRFIVADGLGVVLAVIFVAVAAMTS